MASDRDQRLIDIDFYPGAWGPTIRIATQDRAALLALRSVLLEAARTENYQRDLLSTLSVRATGIEGLVVRTVSSGREHPKALRRLSNQDRIAFEWCQTPSNWEVQAELVDGLLAEDLPGHQYLTEEGVDDALIEVAYRE